MIVVLQPLLAPYRVSLFNRISELSDGRFTLVVGRMRHRRSRPWSEPAAGARFPIEALRTVGLKVRIQSFDVSFGVRRMLDSLHPEVVILPGWNLAAAWVALSWSEERAVPAIAWIETHRASGLVRNRVAENVRRRFLARCALAVVPGLLAERYVRALCPTIPCVRVPNTVDSPELRSLPAPAQPGNALFVGELTRRKGFDIVIDAVEGILGQCAGLTIAGRGPLQDEAARLGTASRRVRYLGFIEGSQMIEAMSAASVVLLPSRRDPWPLAAVEGLVSGRPVVLGQGVGSIPDLQHVADSAVAAMQTMDKGGLLRALAAGQDASVPEEVRNRFTPEEAAASFLQAVERVRG